MATKQLKWENNALKKQAEEITKELSTLREGIKIANNELTHSKSWRSSEETFQADSRDLQFYTLIVMMHCVSFIRMHPTNCRWLKRSC